MKKKYVLDEVLDINVNGDVQNIHIRGNDPKAPVLLFVHGGPGVCDRSWVMPDQSQYLADSFVMVCWDQRMAGKSYRAAKVNDPMSLDQVVQDMHEVVLYLCERFNKEKIYIVGHSWGTTLSCLYLPKHPEHIAAYVGMGQFINGPLNELLSYNFVVDYAKEHGDQKALKDLAKIGAPIDGLYAGGLDALMVQRNYMTKFGGGCYKEKENIYKSVLKPFLTSGEYSIIPDLYRYYMGSFHSLKKIWADIIKLKFDETLTELSVPVFMFQGDHDQNTPTELVRPWFEKLKAPYKEWVAFEESAHSPIKEEIEKWGTLLREKLLALEKETPTSK
ncbi:MAG: alpha/beta hydrolase [Oscillospiraceae bacterium]|nr:alpha/beta hydrolase [Oscillospiraceae bacterium]